MKGKQTGFDIPSGWEIICQAAPRELSTARKSIAELVTMSLNNPIASGRIRDLAKPSSKVAILVDDDTRPTPVKDILPLVLQELHDCNIPKDNIDIVVAVGTHPPMEGKRLETRLGEEALNSYRVTNHDSWAHDLVSVGRVKGIEILVNPIVAQTDLKVGIGTNMPHPFAGFGGGPKIAMPGICGYDTVREHHTGMVMEPGSFLGRIDGNPAYDFIRQASELIGLSYVIDCVVDAQGQPVEIVSGHPIEAHEAGVEICRDIYGVEVEEEADVTIASAYPHEEGPQIIKPILPGAMTTKKGGILILVASCDGGLPETFLGMFDLVRQQNPEDPMETVLNHMRGRNAFLPKSPMDFNCAIQTAFACLERIKVILVSENVVATQVARMGFEHAPDLETAIDMVWRLRTEAKVNVYAAGGIALPLVEKDLHLFGS